MGISHASTAGVGEALPAPAAEVRGIQEQPGSDSEFSLCPYVQRLDLVSFLDTNTGNRVEVLSLVAWRAIAC